MLRRVARRFARSDRRRRLRPDERAQRDRATPSRPPCRAFYARALDQIRAGERAGRGRRHLVLFEPSVLWSAFGSGAPPDFDRDRDVVYAPHIYTGGFTERPDHPRRVRHRPHWRRGASAARPCSPGSGAPIPRRAGKRRPLLRPPPGAPGRVPRERHALDLARELRRPAQGRGPARRASRCRRCGGCSRSTAGPTASTRLRRALIGDLTRGYVRAAPGRPRGHPLHLRRASWWRPGARGGGTGRSWPSCPLTRPSPAGGHGPVPARQLRVGAGLPAHPHAGAQGAEAGPRRPASRRYVVARPTRRPVVAQGGVQAVVRRYPPFASTDRLIDTGAPIPWQ